MRYYYRCCLHNYQETIFDEIKKYRIKYKIYNDISGKWLIFNLFEDMDYFEYIKDLINLDIHSSSRSMEFSKKDMEQAEYFVVWGKIPKINIINYESCFEESCCYAVGEDDIRRRHLTQIGKIKVSGEITWGKRTNFYAGDMGYSELFASLTIKELFENNGVTGINFVPLLKRDNTECLKSFQVTMQNILPEKAFEFGHGERIDYCPVCGKKQYVFYNDYIIHIKKEYLKDKYDGYVSENIFFDGIPEPRYFISSKVYKLLVDNKLTGGLMIEPVKLV